MIEYVVDERSLLALAIERGPMTPWRERILAARERGQFSDDDRNAAIGWARCAVGEQRMLHPTVVATTAHGIDQPEDLTLFTLGSGFAYPVLTDKFEMAENILEAIEDRVLTLKRQIVPE